MSEVDSLLIRVLAAADAARLPVRDWSSRRFVANRFFALKMLDELGTPVRIGGDAATRKSGERLLDELESNKLGTVSRRGRVRFPIVRLTLAGELQGRALAGLPGWEIGRWFTEAIAEQTARNGRTLDRVYLDEIALNGGRGWGNASANDRRALARIELDYLAVSARGWASARSTIHGHVRYRVTTQGWRELDSPTPPPELDLPECDEEGATLYRVVQDQSLAEMGNSEPPIPGELGELPMPTSIHGELVGDAQ